MCVVCVCGVSVCPLLLPKPCGAATWGALWGQKPHDISFILWWWAEVKKKCNKGKYSDLSFSQKHEYSSHLQSKVAELWLSSRWERIPRDALLGHDQLWNLATQTQLRSHVVTGAASFSHTVRFRSEMRVQLMGTDSEHSDTPEASAPYSSDVCTYLWENSSTNSCGCRGQRITRPSQIHHLKCLRRQQGGEGTDAAEVMGGGSLRHTRKDILIIKMLWKWNGRPCEGFIPPEEWRRQHLLGSYRKMCTSKKDGLQDLRVRHL